MEILFAPNTLGITIQAISAIVVALITYVRGPGIVRKFRKSRGPDINNLRSVAYFIAGGIAAALTFIAVGLAIKMLTPKPVIEITTPTAGQLIEMRLAETGSGSFEVSGISSAVYSNSNIKICVLVHPVDPPAAGWWTQQPAIVERNGKWKTLVWTGSRDFPLQPRNKFDIVAVVAKSDQILSVNSTVMDLKDIKPVTQSDIVEISIVVTK